MGCRCCSRRVAIDGPVASGKSAVGRALARRLGYRFIDTGLMYRAVAWAALCRGVDPEDGERLAELARTMDIKLEWDPATDEARVLVDGRDVTGLLRSPEVERIVSAVSARPEVRRVLVEKQRRLAEDGPVVMAGRDIGTVVLPDADFKVFLTASAEERARRRYLERLARGEPADYEAVLADVKRRDEYDSTRPVAPLKPAPDSLVFSTDGLSLDEVVERLLGLICGRNG